MFIELTLTNPSKKISQNILHINSFSGSIKGNALNTMILATGSDGEYIVQETYEEVKALITERVKGM